MAIRRELRRFYGRPWRRYRAELIAVLGERCSRCGVEDPRVNLAHTNHDPRDGTLVALLCASCHARFDRHQRYAMTRRTRARRSGQMWLSQEIEWAPFASWMVPRRVLAGAQRRLFDA